MPPSLPPSSDGRNKNVVIAEGNLLPIYNMPTRWAMFSISHYVLWHNLATQYCVAGTVIMHSRNTWACNRMKWLLLELSWGEKKEAESDHSTPGALEATSILLSSRLKPAKVTRWRRLRTRHLRPFSSLQSSSTEQKRLVLWTKRKPTATPVYFELEF